MSTAPSAAARRRLEADLEARATEASRRFWTRYLKGEAEFRGVPMAGVRQAVHAWWAAEGYDALPPEAALDHAFGLLEGRYTEDRLAGVLLLAERLRPSLGLESLPRFVAAFERGRVADWNLCDWLCVKVLGPMVEGAGSPIAMARAIAAWREAAPLWQRRASLVAFVNLAPHGGARLPGLPALVLETAAVVARDPARFAQTAVGWTLRELSRAEPEAVAAFAEAHAELLSREATKMLTARLSGAKGSGRRGPAATKTAAKAATKTATKAPRKPRSPPRSGAASRGAGAAEGLDVSAIPGAPPVEPVHAGLPVRMFGSVPELWRWLAAADGAVDGVWLRIAKKGSGLSTPSYVEAREAALAHGWIDGLIHRCDDVSYLQRFTPRRRRSKWSKINRGIAEALIAEGRMAPRGLAEVQAARADGRWAAAYDPPSTVQPHPSLEAALAARPEARAAFERLDRATRNALLYRVNDVKRETTRARIVAGAVDRLARGLDPLGRD